MVDNSERLRTLRALAHPLRLRILSLLTGQAMSAAELARALDETQANVSYHLRVLATSGHAHPVEHVTIRGGRATRYRYVQPEPLPAADTTGGSLSVEDHVLYASALGRELERRTGLRDTRQPGPSTDAELWVHPQHWQEFTDAVVAASTRLHARAQATGSRGTVRTSTTISLFQMRPR